MRRPLLVIGGSITLIELLLLVGGRCAPGVGRLPGDTHYRGQNVSCFIPITTAILLSKIVLPALLNLVIRLLKWEESL